MTNFTTWKFTRNFKKFSIKCMITTHNLSIISTTSLLAAIYFSIQEWWFNTDSLGSTDYIVFTLWPHKVELSYIHPNLKQKHTKQKLKTHKGERITWKLRRLFEKISLCLIFSCFFKYKPPQLWTLDRPRYNYKYTKTRIQMLHPPFRRGSRLHLARATSLLNH